MFAQTFRVVVCQESVSMAKNRGAHLTVDGLSLYTRFRWSIVSLSGKAALSSADSSAWMPLTSCIYFVEVRMVVRPFEAYLSRGTPFANYVAASSEKRISRLVLGVKR